MYALMQQQANVSVNNTVAMLPATVHPAYKSGRNILSTEPLFDRSYFHWINAMPKLIFACFFNRSSSPTSDLLGSVNFFFLQECWL